MNKFNLNWRKINNYGKRNNHKKFREISTKRFNKLNKNKDFKKRAKLSQNNK
jgi:hypothetical protein